ncbi:uncharacterized protein SPPG_03381 [Spizellomyces punctatus DAOM BR117]|uniref:Splicing factor 3A subunit 1 conserved domain-containing protein n=1 Tax=Spizellomyces punctatus (strain DAOM BR117) TaxID=645134 RepID=A0A0L0HKP2_SPIPD|nr:hypothetical protein, variant [Spizellomyces punctatus DAOM BR117]XP_016609623.1 uncharacterized protein SPPG_03381 [Spizellomyces punctatus DAOM BR117]KND01583.1 hypothetical protein, variant [Spizellomyces punctatus DAOM BR117]KND01584.1 hypothetical protein SPPG_03381 [Spizellomyces punctatus DAOM BR117]|eukprot:XP_016609622.1 hypothetical protein, variant [Spizellomyces punctatus DAOM BR117]
MTQPIPKPLPGMKIRTNYVPKARGLKVKQVSQICPRCNQPVPASEMAEHVRIELLDPKWKEQRAKARDKHKDSNLDNATVSTNLKLLARTRPDIFVGDEFNIEKTIKEQQQKDSERRKVIWDGHTASIGTVTQKMGQTFNWDDQLAELQKEAEEAAAKANAIGPKAPNQGPAVASFAPPSSAISTSTRQTFNAPMDSQQHYGYTAAEYAASYHTYPQEASYGTEYYGEGYDAYGYGQQWYSDTGYYSAYPDVYAYPSAAPAHPTPTGLGKRSASEVTSEAKRMKADV